jgi:uncharacterized protein YdcH (DUF465 family)
MNAYELADGIEDDYWDSRANKIMLESAKMLRQQAYRIAHLEMLLANRNEIIDKLDLTTPQIKELSDEEIQDLIINKVTDADMIRQALKKASEK